MNHDIQRCITDLEDGEPLTPKSVGAIAVAIGIRFRELAELWGGVRFTVGAWVEMEQGVVLHFCKRSGDGWRFRILCDDHETYVQDSSLGRRQRAAECLPRLEAALEAAAVKNFDKDRLLAAYGNFDKYFAEDES